MQYNSFGACWSDGQCWGAWLYYDSDWASFFSTEITFRATEEVGVASPSVPASPDIDFYGWYQNYMYSFYDGLFNYIWYYMDLEGAMFTRLQPVVDGKEQYQVGDFTNVYSFSSLSLEGNKENYVGLGNAVSLATAVTAVAVSSAVLF